MADLANTAQQQQIREQGWFGKTISLPFRFIGVMLLSLFLSIVFEWIGLYFVWGDQGWHHARDMMFLELDWISDDFTNSFIIEEPGLTASQLVEKAYKVGFEDTGIVNFFHGRSEAFHRDSVRADGGFDQAIGSAMVLVEDYALAAVFSALTFLVRLIVLALTTPLFLMAIALGMVDGLVRRDIRRFGAGLESGFVHHRARATIKPLAVAPWLIYLSMPVSISPILILLPCAALLALSVSITIGSFKKYL
jgi:integrating conjugative element membrane protein (TIGR03747 family)